MLEYMNYMRPFNSRKTHRNHFTLAPDTWNAQKPGKKCPVRTGGSDTPARIYLIAPVTKHAKEPANTSNTPAMLQSGCKVTSNVHGKMRIHPRRQLTAAPPLPKPLPPPPPPPPPPLQQFAAESTRPHWHGTRRCVAESPPPEAAPPEACPSPIPGQSTPMHDIHAHPERRSHCAAAHLNLLQFNSSNDVVGYQAELLRRGHGAREQPCYLRAPAAARCIAATRSIACSERAVHARRGRAVAPTP